MTGKGATIDVGAWLRDLGLGQYEAVFRENEIDVDILPELTEPHLVKLGMPLGHRIRLLKAISNLEASERSAVMWLLHPSRCRLCRSLASRYRKPLASAGTSR